MTVREYLSDAVEREKLPEEQKRAVERLEKRINQGYEPDDTPNLDLTPVELMLATVEERKKQRLLRINTVADVKKRLAAAKKKFEKDFRTSPKYATEWRLAEVLREEANLAIAEAVRPTEKTPVSQIEKRIAHFCDRFLQELSMARAENRSSSDFHNLADDIRNAERSRAYAEFRSILDGSYLS